MAAILAEVRLRLSPEKTQVVHIDEGFDFLGFHIRRMRKRGTQKHYVYTVPSKRSIQSIKDKVRARTYRSTLHLSLRELLISLNQTLRGWANYFRHGTSKATFDYLRHYTWRRVIVWLRRKHPRTWKWLRRHHLPGWWPTDGATRLFDPMTVPVTRYRYRAANIPTPWRRTSTTPA